MPAAPAGEPSPAAAPPTRPDAAALPAAATPWSDGAWKPSPARSAALALALALTTACRPSPPASRVPTQKEAGPELVVVNYAPQRLRALPGGTAENSYLLLGSERPLLPAVFRPLGVTTRKAPQGVAARAGELAWIGGHVVAAPPADPRAARTQQASLLVYDRDSKVATPTPLALPVPCTQTLPLLLHSDGLELHVLVRCPPEDTALVLRLADSGELRSSRIIPGAGAAELLLHKGEVDYLLAGAKVLRAGPAGPPLHTELPGAGAGGPDTRELVHNGSLLLVVDGGAGRLFGLDGERLQLRFSERLYSAAPVTRLRAALASPERLIIATAETTAEATTPAAAARAAGAAPSAPTQLVATALPLAGLGRSAAFPTRILLGSGPPQSDHELVPVAQSDGGGVLLLRTHAGNTGPLVALTHLHL